MKSQSVESKQINLISSSLHWGSYLILQLICSYIKIFRCYLFVCFRDSTFYSKTKLMTRPPRCKSTHFGAFYKLISSSFAAIKITKYVARSKAADSTIAYSRLKNKMCWNSVTIQNNWLINRRRDFTQEHGR